MKFSHNVNAGSLDKHTIDFIIRTEKFREIKQIKINSGLWHMRAGQNLKWEKELLPDKKNKSRK